MDPSLLTLQYVKEEFPASSSVSGNSHHHHHLGGGALLVDPSDPFGLPLGTSLSSFGGGGDFSDLPSSHHQQNGLNLLSPLSTSPMDPPLSTHGTGDFDLGTMEDSVGSVSGSMLSSHSHLQGIPLPHAAGGGRASSSSSSHPPPQQQHSQQQHFYSMSMPVRTTVTGLSQSSHKQVPSSQAPQGLSGSQASSYQSYASNSTGGGGGGSVLPDSLKHLDILNEKRRRRRESHNAVERRRRDHINEKISELSQLLPEFAGDAQNKPNKGTVLKRSVDYLRHIQTFAVKQMERNKELEVVLMRVCEQQGIPLEALQLSVPLGTPIEIPPLSESHTPTDHMMDEEL